MGVSFDRIADRYDSTRGYPDNVMEDILSSLEAVLNKDSLILDAGVGTGRFAQPLQARGYTVAGIDISSRMLEKAKEKGTEDLLRADLCALPFKEGVFRTVMSIHVLHLISTWRCALQEIARVSTDSFISVAFNREESPAEELRRLYDSTCAELGFEVRHPGLRERELPDMLPPDKTTVITIHEHPIDVKSLLDDYEARTYSSQWEVPDDVHEKAIETLRERYAGIEEIMGREKIALIMWTIPTLREFASKQSPES